MASAPPSFASTKETTNYARLCRLLVDVGSQALRDTFDKFHPPSSLYTDLTHAPAHPTLQSLRKKRILNATQWGKLYPTIPSSVSSANFDITLLALLLRNICGLSPPASTGSWDILPPSSDTSPEANIARVKHYRNNVYGHASQASVDDPMFNVYWQDISSALVGLGAHSGASYGAAISKLKTECMDPDFEEHYRELLKEWKKDDDSTKELLTEMAEVLKKRKIDEDSTKTKLGEIEEMLRRWTKEESSAKDKMAGIEEILKSWKTDEDSSNDKLGKIQEMLSQQTTDEGNIKDKLEKIDEILRQLWKDESNKKDKLGKMEGWSSVTDWGERPKVKTPRNDAVHMLGNDPLP